MRFWLQLRQSWAAWFVFVASTFAFTAFAQRQLENLGRGIVAVRTASTQVYVGWRLLGTDPENIAFNLYRATGLVAYGGTLSVVNLSPEFLEAGDNFHLFDAASYTGSFSAVSLPSLEDGLVWNTSQLSVDGRLWVVSTTPPLITAADASSGILRFSGTGGTPGWKYYVQSSTNLALPLAQWTRVRTNQFDAGGNFIFVEPRNPAAARLFYSLQLP